MEIYIFAKTILIMIKRKGLFILLLMSFNLYSSQRLLTSWSQQNIENYTKEMYDEAQKLPSSQLLEKNLKDQYWSEVFLTLNASVNNYTKDINYQKSLAEQITNTSETKLIGNKQVNHLGQNFNRRYSF